MLERRQALDNGDDINLDGVLELRSFDSAGDRIPA